MRANFIYAARLLAARGDFETIMWNNPHGALSQNLVNTHPTSHRTLPRNSTVQVVIWTRENLSQGLLLKFQNLIFTLFIFTITFIQRSLDFKLDIENKFRHLINEDQKIHAFEFHL